MKEGRVSERDGGREEEEEAGQMFGSFCLQQTIFDAGHGFWFATDIY